MTYPIYRVLLYYKYITIKNPETFVISHLHFCNELGLKGRIIISEEGINGTVSGTIAQTEAYIERMHQDPLFDDIVFKVEESKDHAFKKMHVRHRSELVSFNLDEEDVDPNQVTGHHLSPKEFHDQMKEPNTVIIDARNDYEYDVGHFQGAIRPDIHSFRELPQWIKANKQKFKDKKILTYCTGGVRCEKFTGWLLNEGFQDVSQLHGGIITYGQDPEVKGKLWNGQCYVFDERITVPVNREEHHVVGRDHFTNEPCERYVNCANPECNKQILTSVENEHFFLRSCTPECLTHPNNRYIAEWQLTDEEVKKAKERIVDFR